MHCPGTPLTRHIDDYLADLANANKPQNTIRAYRGDLIGFADPCDGDIARAPRGAGPRVPRRDRRAGPVHPHEQAGLVRVALQLGYLQQ